MNIPIIKEDDQRFAIVKAELEKIGLVEDGKISLSEQDRKALLSGGRTELISMYDLKSDGYRIDQLDAKLSLVFDDIGEPELKLHPIYREATYPAGLTEEEAQQLQVGQSPSVTKRLKDEEGKEQEYRFEFDPETKEFIRTENSKVLTPDFVNGEKLSEGQKQDYRSGKNVELSDGTVFRHTALDQQELRSNRAFLLASVFLDGGLSYMIYQGLKALNGLRNTDPASLVESKGYVKAVEEMNTSKVPEYSESKELSHSYTRSGRSR